MECKTRDQVEEEILDIMRVYGLHPGNQNDGVLSAIVDLIEEIVSKETDLAVWEAKHSS